jgi:hypothetical protein
MVSCAMLPGLAKGNPGCIDLLAKSPPTKHSPCGPKTSLPPLNINLQQSDPRIIALVPVWHPINCNIFYEMFICLLILGEMNTSNIGKYNSNY